MLFTGNKQVRFFALKSCLFLSLLSISSIELTVSYTYCDAILSSVLVVRYSFGVAETVGILAAGKEVYRISAVRNAIPADVDISVFDDSCMDPAKVEDYAEVRLAVVDCNLAVEYALRPVEKAVTVVDCRMRGRANGVRRPEIDRSDVQQRINRNV